MKSKRMSVKLVFNILGIIFFAVGAVLFIIGCFVFFSGMNFKDNAEITEAVITDIDVYRKTKGELGHRLLIEYTVDDVEYEQILDEYNSEMYIGKKITVYYDPKNPSDVRTGSLLLPIIFTSIGGGFIIIGSVFLIINIKSSRRRKYLMKNGDVFTGKIINVKMNMSVTINYRHPYKVECEVTDPYTNERYLYSSENITDDISEFIGSDVTVYVDKNNKGKYYVDIKELINKYNSESNIHDYR